MQISAWHMKSTLKYGFDQQSALRLQATMQGQAMKSSKQPRVHMQAGKASQSLDRNMSGLRLVFNLRLLCRLEYDCLRPLRLRAMTGTSDGGDSLSMHLLMDPPANDIC